MGQRFYLFFVAFAAFAMAFGMRASAQIIDEDRKALIEAKAQATKAEQRAADLETKAAAAEGEENRVRSRMAALAGRIQATEADITAGEERVKLIEAMRAAQRARLAERQEPVARLLAALQMMARRPVILSFVQPGSTNDLVHVRAVLEVMIPEIRRKTEGLRTEIAKAQQLKLAAERAVSVLKQSEAKLAQQRIELATDAARYRAESSRYATGAMQEQDRAIAMGEKARDIVDLIDQLGVAATVQNQLATLPGPVLRPAQPNMSDSLPEEQLASREQFSSYRLPVTGILVKGLGEVSEAGVRARGLTIATRSGAQVVAPAAGRVVYAGRYRGFGEILIIDHGAGWTTLITSLAVLDVGVGVEVSEGSPIGKAGNDRPTVTVELRQGARPVDITPLIG
jgi:murein hydrolase activator